MKRLVCALLGAMLASSLLLLGCGGQASQLDKFEATQAEKVVTVPVTTVVARDFERTITGTGSLRADKRTRIQPPMSGRLISLPVEIGDVVHKGDLLAQLRPAEFQDQLEKKKAELEVAKARLADLLAWKRSEEKTALVAGLAEARAAEQRAKRDFERKQELVEAGGISRTDFERAQEEYRRAEAARQGAEARLEEATAGPTKEAVAVAEGQVKTAQAELADAQRQLADTTITAPYDAVVTGKYAEVGQEVNSMMATDILEISDISTLEAYFLISETLIPYLRVGTMGAIEVASTGQIVPATVVAVNPAAEELVRSFMIKAEVGNAEGRLRAGMFIRGILMLERQSQIPSVPREAVRYLISDGEGADVANHNRAMLFLLDEENRVHPTVVQTGLSDAAGYIQVASGELLGRRIVADGALPLIEGQKVQEIGSVANFPR